MALRKCPICELNYITEEKKMCDICLRMRSGVDDEPSLCMICGERLTKSGEDLCVFCKKEHDRSLKGDKNAAEVISSSEVGGFDDIELPIDRSVPEGEMEEIASELGFNETEADEPDDDAEEASADEVDDDEYSYDINDIGTDEDEEDDEDDLI